MTSKVIIDPPITQAEVDARFVAAERGISYPEDVQRIQDVLKSQLGIDLTPRQAETYWEWRSDCYCAGWLIIGSDDEIVEWFEKFIRNHGIGMFDD